MIKKISLQGLCLLIAIILTSISPLILVSKEIKQLTANSSNDTYEVYKGGLPFRYVKRNNISMDIGFDKKFYLIDILMWYALFNIMLIIYHKKTHRR